MKDNNKWYTEIKAWKVEGEAFGSGPAKANVNPPNKVVGHRGSGLVNSYLGKDASTGTLTSPEITIERKHINFLIGAGKHEGETCMNLLVGGKVVGVMGILHPTVLASFDIGYPSSALEISIEPFV